MGLRRRRHPLACLTLLTLTAAGVAFGGAGAPAQGAGPSGDPPKEPLSLRGSAPQGPGGFTASLSSGEGDGSAQVIVDAYGAFGTSTNGGALMYDPIGPVPSASTVYESAVWFSGANQAGVGGQGVWLANGGLPEATLGPLAFTTVEPARATSQWQLQGLDFHLEQRLRRRAGFGSTLLQTYTLNNTTSAPIRIDLIRHVDGDLFFEGGHSNDFGGMADQGQRLFEFDSGDDPSQATTYLGIDLGGQANLGYRIDAFRFTDDVFSEGRAVLNNTIAGDANGDNLTDHGYDVTLTLGRTLNIPAGRTVRFVTNTILGQGAPEDFTPTLYRANLHAHTAHSDGGQANNPSTQSPLAAYAAAAEAGVRAMSVTDHAEQLTAEEWDTARQQATQAFEEHRIVALRGFEWTHTFLNQAGNVPPQNLLHLRSPGSFVGQGHISVFGTAGYVGAHDSYVAGIPVQRNLRDFYNWILAEPAVDDRGDGTRLPVAQFNHPTTYDRSTRFDRFRLASGERGERLRQIFALMELGSVGAIYEGRIRHNVSRIRDGNRSNEHWFRRALLAGWRVAPSNSEDNHFNAYGIRAMHTGIFAPDVSGAPAADAQSVLLDAIRARRVFASEDPDSAVRLAGRLSDDPAEYLMGSLMELTGPEQSVTFNLATINPRQNPRDTFKKIEIIGPPLLGQTNISRWTTWTPRGIYNENRTAFEGNVTLTQADLDRLQTSPAPWGEYFFYARIQQNDGDLVYSAPIWIRRVPAPGAPRQRR